VTPAHDTNHWQTIQQGHHDVLAVRFEHCGA
jgi:hypothetical protein